jgi:hypothetical protein
MWRKTDVVEEGRRAPPLRPDPPPTPRMSATRIQRRGDRNEVEPLSTSRRTGGTVDEPQRSRSRTVTQNDGKDDSTFPLPPASPAQTYEQRLEARRRSEEQSQRKMAAYIKAMEEECERAIYSPADDGAVDLKPLDPPPPPDPPLKPLTPLPPDDQSQKPSVARKRGISAAKLEAERLNKIIKAETEWMTDDPYLRHWAEDAQEDLYGKGVSIAETRSFPSYLPPTRDTNQINRELYDMTLRDQDYQIGGPPRPVNMNNIDWNSDVSNVQGYSEFQEARDAKAFASYVMFTERQEEIDMLRRMQVHGFLKDGVEIKYGYQAQGPQGAVAWLTNEGQEIGGRLREEYERERAVTGEFAISDCRIDKSEVGARSRAVLCGFGPRTPISRASATPTHPHLPMSFTC